MLKHSNLLQTKFLNRSWSTDAPRTPHDFSWQRYVLTRQSQDRLVYHSFQFRNEASNVRGKTGRWHQPIGIGKSKRECLNPTMIIRIIQPYSIRL
jgi:hypothetical protein